MLNLVCIIYGNIFAEFLSKTFKKPKQSCSVFNVKIIYLFSKILFKAYLSCRWKRVDKLRCAFVLKKISTNLDTYNRPAM